MPTSISRWRAMLRAVSCGAAVAFLGLAALSALSSPPAQAQGLPAAAASSAAVDQASDPEASYKEVDLKAMVGSSRSEVPGQRIIFAPSPIKFRATLAAMPAPQKADYLKKALGMMGVGGTLQVSQRIGLGYGGDKALAAYIDDAAAARLAREAKVGQQLNFYAYHVYNHSRGPALVVTSFSN
jgi:hypothetical protein